MKKKYYWIKERDNPQIGVYFVGLGQISVKEARNHEKSLYGSNIMHKFTSREDYENELKSLEEQGERVQ